MEPPTRSASLAEVVQRGGPAQAEEARRLLAVLDEHPDDPSAARAADELIDAYLNDPHLTRYPTAADPTAADPAQA